MRRPAHAPPGESSLVESFEHCEAIGEHHEAEIHDGDYTLAGEGQGLDIDWRVQEPDAGAQELPWLQTLLPKDPDPGVVRWQTRALLSARQREGAAAIEKDRVVALWVCTKKMHEQVMDIPANACAPITVFRRKQLRIDADLPTSR